ncbi:YggS family pyridoxal phosphate-dependent enzyme [archaeon]|nr:MAG: YggS family pyridoxal phosphate-dependent enzyme [archaeon]
MIEENVKAILAGLPPGVLLVAAAKTRTADDIKRAINAGVSIIGENYLQEAEVAYTAIGKGVSWHFIGYLQRNKVKKAVRIFDMIETVDSLRLAVKLDKECAKLGKVISVLVEVNSGLESQKTGVFPQEVEGLINKLASMKNLKVEGLMTMGPRFGEPEKARPYFRETKRLFDKFQNLPNVRMRYLSMGMSNTYQIAIEEGANIVRIGAKLFGKRDYG